MSPFISVIAAGLVGGFGHFAFTDSYSLPACEITPNSFRVKSEGAPTIVFGQDRKIATVAMTRYFKEVQSSFVQNSPLRIRYEPTSIGFSLEYAGGFVFSGSGNAPFISWSEGTVGPDVPSAPSTWALLSWSDPKPPILLCFPSGNASLVSEKNPSGFQVRCTGYTGKVFVRFPFGSKNIATRTAADFGGIVAPISQNMSYLSAPAPHLIGVAYEKESDGITAIWKFDRPGALIPLPVIGGVRLGSVRIINPTRPAFLGGDDAIRACAGDELRLRFTMARLRPGAAGVAGAPGAEEPGSLADSALALLCGNAPQFARLKASLAAAMKTVVEPTTTIPLPHEDTGAGSASAAERFLAGSALGVRLTWADGLFAGLDWTDWLPAGGDHKERVEAAALLALAGPLLEDPEERILAAMANAALADEPDAPSFSVRRWLYPNAALARLPKPGWLAAMQSPIRIFTPGVAAAQDASGLWLVGTAETIEAFDLTVKMDAPFEIGATENLDQVIAIADAPATVMQVRPRAAGPWRIKIVRLSPGAALPKAAPSPRYSADRR
jgi:hypothetical protein